jgi:hypothetical protein
MAEDAEMSYQVEKYDSRWNEIRDEKGNLLYCANRVNKQIYRIEDGYASGPMTLFLGRDVTRQFKENEIKRLCL